MDKIWDRKMTTQNRQKSNYFSLSVAHPFKSYSFRIGDASYVVTVWLFENQIDAVGRWKSSSFSDFIYFEYWAFTNLATKY